MARKKAASIVPATVPEALPAVEVPKAVPKAEPQGLLITPADMPAFKKALDIAEAGVPDYAVKNFVKKMKAQFK